MMVKENCRLFIVYDCVCNRNIMRFTIKEILLWCGNELCLRFYCLFCGDLGIFHCFIWEEMNVSRIFNEPFFDSNTFVINQIWWWKMLFSFDKIECLSFLTFLFGSVKQIKTLSTTQWIRNFRYLFHFPFVILKPAVKTIPTTIK